MEFNLPSGYTAIRTEELHNIQKFAVEFKKFIKTYHIYNRQLNNLFKIAGDIVDPQKPPAEQAQGGNNG